MLVDDDDDGNGNDAQEAGGWLKISIWTDRRQDKGVLKLGLPRRGTRNEALCPRGREMHPRKHQERGEDMLEGGGVRTPFS